MLKRDNIAKKIELGDLYTIQTASNHIYSLSKLSDQESDFLTPLLLDALEQNVFYDQSATEKMLQQELENLSTARGMVQQGQVIISQGELITDEKYLALTFVQAKLRRAKLERRFWKLVFARSIVISICSLVNFLPFFTTIQSRCFSR